jgi:arylsulfatase A-like enzyme
VKIRNLVLGVVAVAVVAAGGAIFAIKTNPLLLVHVLAALRERKIEPNRPVVWQQGPATAELPADKRKPNIVFILADDLGFNDLTYNGGGVAGGAVPTPNIDSISHDGVTFTQGYSGNATCAPSRAAIMTGRYATRFGYEFTPTHPAFEKLVGMFHSPGAIHPPIYHSDLVDEMPSQDKIGLPTSEITIAKMLQSQGYHTLMFGKWHLGEAKGQTPNDVGFDESLGFLIGAQKYLQDGDPNVVEAKQDFDPIDKFLWAALPFTVSYNNGPMFRPSEYMTDYLGDQAVKAIAANKNRPFFMYLAFNAPHTPLQALRSDYDALPQIKDHRLRVYAAMIRSLDRNVGKVLEALKANGLDENTLVIFTSDNGGAHYIGLPEINKPYRGWKATFFEGGIHVPYFLKWPAQLPKGVKYDEPAAHVDIFATAAGAAGVQVPTDRVLDGVNLLPYVEGKAQGAPHKTLFWRSGDYKVLLDGEWKLQVSARPDKVWLFDLKTDPTEKTNLAAAQPDKVAELKKVLADVDGQQSKPIWPALLEGAIAIDHPLNVPDKPDDEYIYWAN